MQRALTLYAKAADDEERRKDLLVSIHKLHRYGIVDLLRIPFPRTEKDEQEVEQREANQTDQSYGHKFRIMEDLKKGSCGKIHVDREKAGTQHRDKHQTKTVHLSYQISGASWHVTCKYPVVTSRRKDRTVRRGFFASVLFRIATSHSQCRSCPNRLQQARR